MEKISENAVRAVPDVNNSACVRKRLDDERGERDRERVNAGDPVTADDADDDSLTYSISGGADMDAFGITLQRLRPDHGQGRARNWTTKAHRGPTRSRSRPATRSAERLDDGDHQGHERQRSAGLHGSSDDPTATTRTARDPWQPFTATDPEGAGVDWSLKGTDAALFSIDVANGVLTFKKSPNFEMPLDIEREAVT